MIGPLLLAAALALPGNDVALLRPVEGRGLSGTPSAVTDGLLAGEETPAAPRSAAILADTDSVLVIPLGTVRQLRGVVLQCEADDDYMVERSLDGHAWSGLLHVKGTPRGSGLQTQAVALEEPQPALFLAVHAQGGDGHYAVSELQAFEVLPVPFPPRLRTPGPLANAQPPWTDREAVRWKGLLAAAGAIVLLLRRRAAPPWRGLLDAALVAAAALAFFGWWNFGHFHFSGRIHVHDSFHYVVGAKYFPENGYTGLYEAAVAADLSTGREPPAVVRDLATNDLATIDAGKALERARARFSPERWEAFEKDVGWFHDAAGPLWPRVLQDHGFNATPVWTIAGRLLASAGPVSEAELSWLTAIDDALLVAMWIAVAWAFGWETAAVALLFWGTWEPARYFWNGGSVLRMDWLFCSVLGVCLLRKKHPLAAGAALAAAAFLRVFPGALLLGLALTALLQALRTRKLSPTTEERRIAAGALLAALLLGPASLVVPGRPHAWQEFAANSRKHLATPLLNNMGLRSVLSLTGETRLANVGTGPGVEPFAEYKSRRRAIAAARAPVAWLLGTAGMAAFALALAGRPSWAVAAAAAGLMPVLFDLTCYYTSLLLLLALLASLRTGIGPMLAALSAVSCLLPSVVAGEDDRYALLSALVLLAVAAVWWLARNGGTGRPDEAGVAPAPSRGRRSGAAAAVLLMTAVYVLAVAPETVRQDRALETRAYDMGIMENVFWNTVHGQPFQSSIEGGSHLGVHTSFIYLALVPLYAAIPRTETLLVLQTLALALAAWPLFLVAEDLAFPPAAAALVAGLWLVHPAVAGANFYDFHELAFGPVLFFTAFHLLLAGRWRLFAGAIALLLLVKEDMSLVVAALGVWCLLGKRVRAGAALVAVGAAAYVTFQCVVIPHFAHRAHSFAWYYGELIPPGAGPTALLAVIVSEPLRVARLLLTRDRVVFVAQLFLPLLFAALLSVRSLALVAYGLLASLLASRAYLHRLGFQYPLQILPYAFAGSLDAISRWSGRFPRLRTAWVAGAAAASLVVAALWGPPSERLAGGFRIVDFSHPESERARFADVTAAAALIPPGASVTASETLVPHVARRADVYTLRYADRGAGGAADYVFLLDGDATSEAAARFTEGFGRYEVVRRGSATLLLRRVSPG